MKRMFALLLSAFTSTGILSRQVRWLDLTGQEACFLSRLQQM